MKTYSQNVPIEICRSGLLKPGGRKSLLFTLATLLVSSLIIYKKRFLEGSSEGSTLWRSLNFTLYDGYKYYCEFAHQSLPGDPHMHISNYSTSALILRFAKMSKR